MAEADDDGDVAPVTDATASLAGMSDERLRSRLSALAWGEKQVLVQFLLHLQEFDRRRSYAPSGYTSLFRYCIGELALSEDEAYLRIQAARLALRFPELLDMLAAGEIHLSGLARLSPHLSAANGAALLAEARGKSKRDVERIAARFCPPGPQADSIRFLQAPSRALETPTGDALPLASSAGETGSEFPEQSPALESVSAPDRPPAGPGPIPSKAAHASNSEPDAAAGQVLLPPDQVPVAPRLVRIGFTVTEDLWRKIELARALTRHQNPSGRMEPLIEAAFDSLLDARDPGRRRPARRRAPTGRGAASRRVPRRVKEQVWRRDGGRCAFAAPDGHRCGATEWLEYDHVLPFALGGRSNDPANIRLLCRTHNQFASRQAFGDSCGRGESPRA